MLKIREIVLYRRSFVYGVEDSLVSTVGLLSGIASADSTQRTIILSGLILLLVESLSMGVGNFLSESSTEKKLTHISTTKRAIAGIITFISYYIAGFVVLFPYIFFSMRVGFYVSIMASLISLLLLGMYSSRFSNSNMFISGLRMLGIGGIVIVISVLTGRLLELYIIK